MGRHEQREQVFILLFQAEFHKPEEMPRQMRLYLDGNEEIGSQKTADKIEERCQKICGKIPELRELCILCHIFRIGGRLQRILIFHLCYQKL